jgi:hypothetical protein
VRGGTTLVIRDDGWVRYAIAKALHPRRQQAQIDFANGHEIASANLYTGRPAGVDLRALHRGY